MTDPADDMNEPAPSSTEEIRADIDQTRAELSETVDQLADKLNVKAQVGNRVDSAKDTVAEKAAQAKAAAPEPVQHALDKATQTIGPAAHRANAATRPYRTKVLAGAAAALVVLLIVRRARQGSSS